MFKKVLIAEDMDFINSGIKAELSKLGITQIDDVQYCDEALLKLKSASLKNAPFDLLISDLSFDKNYIDQKITSGDELIKVVRKEFPSLKIAVFSVEDKEYRVQTLFNEHKINAYVWKSREGLRELKKAVLQLYTTENIYVSPHVAGSMRKSQAIEIVEYDIFLIECLSLGYLQEEISTILKEKSWSPTSVSSIEKRLKFLREHFNANNPTHLVAIAKDLGLV
ncbi:response regulator transcription factor [Lutibacter flavus]|uniref:DNA-binding response regulator, NarL/FixJ family, contains REC and HTH domains n=1 Tax=Lutibacter flavus TaxID=691689 RepID=A0A238VSD7_9FLAO|nr:response regulator transcription factor [Lutibacter flavus]SNR37091.1 DNA-binding response regulator, NarL/FixJ family, contains REC and HTH domains [Lutibacter flavus]